MNIMNKRRNSVLHYIFFCQFKQNVEFIDEIYVHYKKCEYILYIYIGVTSFFNILKIVPAIPSCMYEYRSHTFCQYFENVTCYSILYV